MDMIWLGNCGHGWFSMLQEFMRVIIRYASGNFWIVALIAISSSVSVFCDYSTSWCNMNMAGSLSTCRLDFKFSTTTVGSHVSVSRDHEMW